MLIDKETQYTVGLEVNANHVGSAREGMATAKAKIIHKGKKTHVWSIEISDDNNKLLCGALWGSAHGWLQKC